MNRRYVFALLLMTLAGGAARASDTTRPDSGDADSDSANPDQESESKDIIPPGGITVSTQPITPVAVLPDKKSYDQGLEELALAQDLWAKGKAEAASDVALQAYDDLMTARLARRDKKKRQKLRADRHLAASVYMDTSLAYIQDYVKKAGGTPRALEEGRARLGDLRDVAMNYPELNKKLTKALEPFAVEPSTPAVSTH